MQALRRGTALFHGGHLAEQLALRAKHRRELRVVSAACRGRVRSAVSP